MNLKELIDKKGFPKIFFDSNSKNNQPFCIYELEEEIILNSNGCFLNGKKHDYVQTALEEDHRQ